MLCFEGLYAVKGCFVSVAGGPVLCCALKVCMSLIVFIVVFAGGLVLCWSFGGCEWLFVFM